MAAASAGGGTSLASYDTLFTHHKAGMKDEDKEKIKKIVFEMSKGSPFFKEQERRDQRVSQHIASCKDRLARLSVAELAVQQQRADRALSELDSSRKLERIWACVDMDAFFAACEALEDPSLRGDVPFAVGGTAMISTASYAARRYGVRSAMPGFIAQRLAKEAGIHLRFVPCDHAKYMRYAEKSRSAFRLFDEAFIPMSCDEAFLDLTGYCERHAVDAAEAARRALTLGGLEPSASMPALLVSPLLVSPLLLPLPHQSLVRASRCEAAGGGARVHRRPHLFGRHRSLSSARKDCQRRREAKRAAHCAARPRGYQAIPRAAAAAQAARDRPRCRPRAARGAGGGDLRAAPSESRRPLCTHEPARGDFLHDERARDWWRATAATARRSRARAKGDLSRAHV